ncbi:MAG: phosphotransferase family protein [Nitriliruptorales bacterium]|nr:phosphotransferase family protein [Nitriliruptorales bacterium]
MTEIPGIDADGVRRWLADRADVQGDLAFTMVEGGRSNLTFTVADDNGIQWVLRRPPLHGVLESAHDMGREARILLALADSEVPVPDVIGLESDEDVTGAPFYVMQFVDGLVIRDEPDAERLTPGARGVVADRMLEVLGALHAIDPEAVGLGNLGRHEGYLERQLRRWKGQLDKGAKRDLPLMHELHTRLAADIPQQQGVAIVHGDYRLDNMIVTDDGSIQAVLDWELCTLGDPLADVGLLQVYWFDPEDEPIGVVGTPTRLPGFPRRADLPGLYMRHSDRDLSELAYYVAFGRWKLSAILEGVATRYEDGAYGEEAADALKALWGVIDRLTEAAAEATEEAGR